MSGSIRFTETMRGQLGSPPQARGTRLDLLGLRVQISSQPAQGMDGMRGSIEGGQVQLPWLCPDSLEVLGGSVEILRRVPEQACEMRYELLCALPGSAGRLRLQGVKDISHRQRLLLPRAIWRETTTLQVMVFEVAGITPAAPVPERWLASGTAVIHARDFARQLLTFRSTSPAGYRAAAINLLQFLRFFVRRLAEVYLRPRPARPQ